MAGVTQDKVEAEIGRLHALADRKSATDQVARVLHGRGLL